MDLALVLNNLDRSSLAHLEDAPSSFKHTSNMVVVLPQLKFTTVSEGNFWRKLNANADRPQPKIHVKNRILFTGNLSTMYPHKGLTKKANMDKNV